VTTSATSVIRLDAATNTKLALSHDLTNNGTLEFTGNGLGSELTVNGGAGTLINAAGATFAATGASFSRVAGHTDNRGTITSDITQLTLQGRTDNTGTIEFGSGIMFLHSTAGASTNPGTITSALSGWLVIQLEGGATFTTSGTIATQGPARIRSNNTGQMHYTGGSFLFLADAAVVYRQKCHPYWAS
jgi:hypothetical protein